MIAVYIAAAALSALALLIVVEALRLRRSPRARLKMRPRQPRRLPALEDRIRGAKTVLSKDLTIAGTSFCNEDVALGVSQVENVLRAHPALIGYIMIGAWPLFSSPGALPTLKARAKAGLQVVAFDYLEQELPFIVDGTVKASVGQDYWGWGYQSVQICHGLLQGKKYPAFVPQSLPVVTTANVGDYQKKWDNSKTAAGMAAAFKEAPIEPS